jgi:TolB protein
MKRIAAVAAVAFLLGGCASSQKTVTREEGVPAAEDVARLEAKVAEQPANPSQRVTLARAYAARGEFEQALAQLDAAIEADSAFDAAWLEKAEVLERMGRREESLRLYLDLLDTPRGEAYVARIAERIGRPFSVSPIGLGPGDNAAPSFSPDGTKLVFQSNRDGNWEIYLHDFDTETTVRLTDYEAMDEAPVFSPDGEWIAFTSTRDDTEGRSGSDRRREIYLMQPSGFGQRRLTEHPADDWGAVFSPNGQAIVFVSERDDERDVPPDEKWSDLYLVGTEGGTVVRLTENESDDTSPAFLPNGKELLYVSNADGTFRIYRLNIETKAAAQVTDFPHPQGGPRVSADGQWIVFFAKVGDNYDIYRMSIDGDQVQRLTNHSARDLGPTFSADGRKIAFYTNRAGKYQIYQIDLDLPVSKEELTANLEQLLTAGTN